MTDQPRRVPEHVLRAGAAAAASSALVRAVRATDSLATMPDPARGQLWRSCWEDITQLVLVLRVTQPGIAVVAPVTTDPPAADDISAVLSPDLTVLGHPATVWGGLAVSVPLVVFDLAIGDIAARIVDAVEQIAAGHRTGVLPAGVSVGAPVMSAFDQAAEVRAELADNLEILGQAAWAPQGSGSAPRPLRELLQNSPDLSALKEALGLGLPAVIDIVMGRRPVTPVQAADVAAATGLTAELVLSAVSPLPAELVNELDRPRWRRAVRARRRAGEPEAATRLAVAYEVLALAARQTGPVSAPPWPQRIRQYLATSRPGETAQ